MLLFSHFRVWLFCSPIACHQVPLSMGFLRQEYWSGLPFPPSMGSSWPRYGTRKSCLAGTESPAQPSNKTASLEEVIYFHHPIIDMNLLSLSLREYKMQNYFLFKISSWLCCLVIDWHIVRDNKNNLFFPIGFLNKVTWEYMEKYYTSISCNTLFFIVSNVSDVFINVMHFFHIPINFI